MDVSFPAASLIVSNTMPVHQQGVAASLVNTAINWSVSLGLGVAGTVNSQLLKQGKTTLEGFRGGLYVGIGLSAAATIVALLFCRVPSPMAPDQEKKQSQNEIASPTVASDTVIDVNMMEGEGLEGEFPIIHRF
jgi:hypothetical protein